MDLKKSKKKIRVMSYEVNFKGETLRINSILDGKRNFYGESRIKQVKLLRAQGGCPGTRRR